MSSQPKPGAGSAVGNATGFRGSSSSARKTRALGIVALVVAVLTSLLMPVTTVVVNQPAFIDQAGTISATVMTVQLFGIVIALGLAVAAVVTRRGRAWGIAALAVIGLIVLMALTGLLMSLGGGGASTPVR